MDTQTRTPAEITKQRVNDQLDSQMKDNVQRGLPASHPNQMSMLHPGASTLLQKVAENVFDGRAKVGDLMRAHKHLPDSGPGLLAKYIVHRINNLDKYDAPKTAEELDNHFISKNKGSNTAHLKPHDLHIMLHHNIHLVSGMMKHRDMLQDFIGRGVGLKIREANGQKYVALHRSVFNPAVSDAQALSSFSETERPGAGIHQMHMWVPVKDIWFAYNAAPKWVSGSFGHENEYLVSNSAEKFIAKHTDCQPSRFGDVPEHVLSIDGKGEGGTTADLLAPVLDDASDEHTATLIPNNEWLVNFFERHPERLGPISYAAIQLHYPHLSHYLLGAPGVPREEAMRAINSQEGVIQHIQPLKNPNLTKGDLASVIASHNLFVGSNARRALDAIVEHRQFDEELAQSLLNKGEIVASYLQEQHLDDKADEVLAEAYTAVLSSKAPHKTAKLGLLAGLANDRNWAIHATMAIQPVREDTEFGDRLLQAITESRLRMPAAWKAVDFSIPFATLPFSDGMVRDITDAAAGKPHSASWLGPYLYDGKIHNIMYTLGRYNPFIVGSQAQILSKSEDAVRGMLKRSDWLPASVQMAVVKHPTPEWVDLARRSDLNEDAIKEMLQQLKFMDPGQEATYAAKQKYAELLKPVLSSFATNEAVSWQTLWSAVQAKNTAAMKLIDHLKVTHQDRWIPQFDSVHTPMFEAELLNAILRKRLNERAAGAEDLMPPQELPGGTNG